MTIRGRMYATAVVSIAFVCSIVGAAIFFSLEFNREIDRAASAEEYAKQITGLMIIVDQYLAYQEVRSEEQLASKLSELESMIDASAQTDDVRVVRTAFKALSDAFYALRSENLAAQSSMGDAATVAERARYTEMQDRLGTVIRSEAQKILAAVMAISEDSRERVYRRQGYADSVLIALAVLAALVVGLATLSTARRVSGPVAHLRQRAAQMGDGDLEQPIPDFGGDEIGDLAASLELMRVQLSRTLSGVEKANRELAAINALAHGAGARTGLDDVVAATLASVADSIRPSGAWLYSSGPSGLVLLGETHSDMEEPQAETAAGAVGRLCRRAVATGELTHDAATDDGADRPAGDQAALPLLIGDQVVGALGLASLTPRDFPSEAAFLEAFAAESALCLQNAFLFEEVGRHVDELESRVAERTRDLESALEQLSELDRLKSMFIATMSHELRTPLNSIIGFTGIILQGLSGPTTQDQRNQLQRVSRAAKHLLALITDIIDISKIEAGKLEAVAVGFGLGEVIEEAIETLKAEASKKDLRMEFVGGSDLLMHTDRGRLMQCLLNYLGNAVKFTDVGTVRVEVEDLGECVEIRVSDSGIGIPEEDLSRIFVPFTRLDSALSTGVPGTGLGLYLTRKIVTELLHGSVSVESESGVGSTFGLKIPKVLAAA